ncbi:MAG: tyrosine-type recombinase/integrase [Pseudonocardiales bacterium]|nr:tyrosine-type recombinase/integrase [Pseudonocardiales bacterium]
MVDPFKVRVPGPLLACAQGVARQMLGAGYSPRTVRDYLYVLARLSRWLDDEGLAAGQLTAEVVQRFLLARRNAGYRRWCTVRSMEPMLAVLRDMRVIPMVEQPSPDSAVEVVLVAYRRYVMVERRLAAASVMTRVGVARGFLSRLVVDDELRFDQLTSAVVSWFVLDQSRRYRPASMKVLTVALRCLVRFLFLTGVIDRDLSAAVPAVAHRAARLPQGVDDATLVALLNSCERSTAVGLRDYAILTLLIRLGLRAGEVAALRLDDVDWRSGEVVIRGKGNRLDRLPLPHDVGAVVVDYLRRRPRSTCRALFLRACGPHGPMTARSVTMVPRTASARAGLVVVGAHRLRHSAATAMLRSGAPLPEIAQALRHHAEASTARYAAVDRAALDTVARAWPGDRR